MLQAVSKIQFNTTTGDERRRPVPEEGPLTILYEDEWVIALDKPAGLVVHPTYKNTSGTLLNAVLWHVRDRADAQPGILTRLDKDTSGLVVIALTPHVHALMQRDMTAGRVIKEYLAVVTGVPLPPSGRIVLPLARDTEDRRRVVVTASGAQSETRYEVIASSGTHAVVRCVLITGRTHQIRVHMAASGWPIVGDAVYGTAADPTQSALLRSGARPIARQALHAWRVTLPHPHTRETLTIEAPVPADLQPVIDEASA
jgi:23S rRNA pseudouridine1911/1915/1917 synthase